MKSLQNLIILYYLFLFTQCTLAQPLQQRHQFTRQDTLRGSITAERAWWDVLRYDINIQPDFNKRSIEGVIMIRFKVLQPSKVMQIDLQNPMDIAAVKLNTKSLSYKREGNVFFIEFPEPLKQNNTETITINFNGIPRPALRPPWDGGWIWSKDAKGRPWMSVACQGLGASVWYPCKDHQSDEPDQGASLTMIVPDTLTAIANGKLLQQSKEKEGFVAYTWEVKNPINNYNIIPYIGKYVNWQEIYNGEKGPLSCNFWVLDYNLGKAKQQFVQVPQTLKALEHWFGPYPFYEDGYKLVEAPHLGMEHQSAVAYGNKFMNGYMGSDLSGTGWGTKWDYIIVHETGHEWFGNNITTKDVADMWVQEGFTDYFETLFTEYYYGKEAGSEYCRGLRKHIKNDKTIIGPYGVNQRGSIDMYYKGANLIHTLRQIINNDEQFREILRSLNADFYHKTVTSKQIEEYISKQSGKEFSSIFNQYLRTTVIPLLKIDTDGNIIKYKWDNCIDGFKMPVKFTNGKWLTPTTNWQQVKWENINPSNLKADPNFYIHMKVDD